MNQNRSDPTALFQSRNVNLKQPTLKFLCDLSFVYRNGHSDYGMVTGELAVSMLDS